MDWTHHLLLPLKNTKVMRMHRWNFLHGSEMRMHRWNFVHGRERDRNEEGIHLPDPWFRAYRSRSEHCRSRSMAYRITVVTYDRDREYSNRIVRLNPVKMARSRILVLVPRPHRHFQAVSSIITHEGDRLSSCCTAIFVIKGKQRT